MSNLDKKIALVTGASRGIGRATAVALANGGARVIIHYGRSAPEAESLRKQIAAAGGDADIVSTDLAAPDGLPTSPNRSGESRVKSSTFWLPTPASVKLRRSRNTP
jgi:NAD(P)-dependent dehydrogenase (short-subunit alcohol dehydrogenase family)